MRSEATCPFGILLTLNKSTLPTFRVVMKYLFIVRDIFTPENAGKEPTVYEAATRVARKVCELWRLASLPIMSERAVTKWILRHHRKYYNLWKNANSPKEGLH